MPRWRKLPTNIVRNLDLRRMPDDFTRLLWVLLPLVLDREGRGLDLPVWVRSAVFPVREDVTDAQVAAAMDWYADHGLIERYEVAGTPCFRVPSWRETQGDCSREAESELPPPPTKSEAGTPAGPDAAEIGRHPGARSRAAAEPLTSGSRTAQEALVPGSAPDSAASAEQDADAETTAPRTPAPPGTKRRTALRAPPDDDAAAADDDAERLALRAELERYLSPEAARRLSQAAPERVLAHVAHYRWALRQGRAKGPGWLVRAIEEDWPIPPEVRRAQAQYDRRRYISGKYADLIQR